MPDFTSNQRLHLGHGVTVRAVDVRGSTGDERQRAGRRAADPLAERHEILAGAVAHAGMRVRTTVDLPVLEPVGARPRLELALTPGGGEAQVVLEDDPDTGFVRWHLPRPDATRRRYDIPVGGARKALHVLSFPVDNPAGFVADKLVTLWEKKNRPYGLFAVNPDGTHRRDTVDVAWFARQTPGTVLLLVHGTFSTGRSAFAGLCDDADFKRLHDAYDGRVLVFDHPSLHASPADNVRWLRDRLPADRRLTVDLLAHSRGGLVARQLGLPGGPRVNRMLQVATPNAGTALCSPKRIGTLLDVTTNLASALPESPASATLEAVLAVVRQVGLGAFTGLDGLTAMDPDGPQLKALNRAKAPTYQTHAIVANYEPGDAGDPVGKALDATVDAVFGADNDLVVPTASMSRGGRFTVDKPFHVTVGAGERPVAHSSYFTTACVREEIARHLTG